MTANDESRRLAEDQATRLLGGAGGPEWERLAAALAHLFRVGHAMGQCAREGDLMRAFRNGWITGRGQVYRGFGLN